VCVTFWGFLSFFGAWTKYWVAFPEQLLVVVLPTCMALLLAEALGWWIWSWCKKVVGFHLKA